MAVCRSYLCSLLPTVSRQNWNIFLRFSTITHRLIKNVSGLWAVFFCVFVHSFFACSVRVGVFLPRVFVYLCVCGPCLFKINVVMDQCETTIMFNFELPSKFATSVWSTGQYISEV